MHFLFFFFLGKKKSGKWTEDVITQVELSSMKWLSADFVFVLLFFFFLRFNHQSPTDQEKLLTGRTKRNYKNMSGRESKRWGFYVLSHTCAVTLQVAKLNTKSWTLVTAPRRWGKKSLQRWWTWNTEAICQKSIKPENTVPRPPLCWTVHWSMSAHGEAEMWLHVFRSLRNWSRPLPSYYSNQSPWRWMSHWGAALKPAPLWDQIGPGTWQERRAKHKTVYEGEEEVYMAAPPSAGPSGFEANYRDTTGRGDKTGE